MKIFDILNYYYLHDSSIENIDCVRQENKIIMDIELCNWMQSSYIEGEKEIINVQLVFYNVSKFKLEPESALIGDNEISHVEYNVSKEGREQSEFILIQNSHVVVIFIEAEDAEWIINE